VNVNWCFEWIFGLHLQGRRLSPSRNRHEAGSKRGVPGLFFDPEDGSDMLIRNVIWRSPDYTVLYRRRQNSSRSLHCSPHLHNLNTERALYISSRLRLHYEAVSFSINYSKLKLSLCLTNYAQFHEWVWESGCIEPHNFLTSALVGGGWSASRLGRFTPGGESPQYPLNRRLGWPQSRSG
jgi:hypothetical protein